MRGNSKGWSIFVKCIQRNFSQVLRRSVPPKKNRDYPTENKTKQKRIMSGESKQGTENSTSPQDDSNTHPPTDIHASSRSLCEVCKKRLQKGKFARCDNCWKFVCKETCCLIGDRSKQYWETTCQCNVCRKSDAPQARKDARYMNVLGPCTSGKSVSE